MSRLQLTRPLVVFDLETTGVNTRHDRIVEICIIKIDLDGTREARTRRLNPTIPIPEGATAIHGITDADVADEPTFRQVGRSLHALFVGCDILGYNVKKFDLPLLQAEFERMNIDFPDEGVHVVDPLVIFHQRERRDLEAAYAFYCDKTLQNAHSAEADAMATADVLLGQLERYEDLPGTIEALHAVCHPRDPDWIDPDGKLRWDGDVPVLSFGNHRGVPLGDLVRDERSYLEWILGADFPAPCRDIVRDALSGVLPVRFEAPDKPRT
ncbi:MAG: 3'-5' exonuclease [Myxococcota bacterium]|jgi:DNA polymerase-3 subunit epsilon|nr:3'-5' exonuclease [Myxococcota bacterium]